MAFHQGNSKRVLVWGPFGFIGRYLVQSLLNQGYSVVALARRKKGRRLPDWYESLQWHFLNEDPAANPSGDSAAMQAALAGVETVFDLAGSSGAVQSNRTPHYSLITNCQVHLDFLSACAAAATKPHIIFASSRLVYGRTGDAPVKESSPVKPLSIYGAHKFCIESYLDNYAGMGVIDATICRISNVYGFDEGVEGQGYKIINLFVQRSLEGKPIRLFGDGSQLRDLIYISDLVDAFMLCAENLKARNQTFNIGLGDSISMLEAARWIQELTSSTGIEFAPWPRDYELVETGDFTCDISKARQLLGFSPVFNSRQGLAETVRLHRHANEGSNLLTAVGV